jgi:hypothetical protein
MDYLGPKDVQFDSLETVFNIDRIVAMTSIKLCRLNSR